MVQTRVKMASNVKEAAARMLVAHAAAIGGFSCSLLPYSLFACSPLEARAACPCAR
ncbi:hypothetical protein Dimus_037615, partial [Dionaea muscipula]